MDLGTALGLIAGVLVVSALAAGLVERAPLSFPMLFLGLGLVVGDRGLELISVGLDSRLLEVVAIVTLALVLFLDAVNLELTELRRDWLAPLLVLGPATLLVAGLLAGAGMLLLGLPVVLAALLGTILASTDPVVLRDVLRDPRIPRSVRRTLSVEAGTNDIVVLPILLVLIAIAHADLGGPAEWLGFLGQLLVLGPAAGFAVGAAGSWVMGRVDQRFHIRPEYQSLYGIGLVLGAFVAGEAAGGDGFLGAFAAGLAVTAFNQTLCNCFLDFGQVIAETTMLVAFVLFGAVLSSLVGEVPLLATLALAVLAIFVIRPLVVRSVLRVGRAGLSRYARQFIGWFGPRGLASLLFALLVVEDGVPGGEALFAVVGVVVLVSVVAHGVTATPFSGWYARRASQETLVEERASTAAELFAQSPDDVPPGHPGRAGRAPGRTQPAGGAGCAQPLGVPARRRPHSRQYPGPARPGHRVGRRPPPRPALCPVLHLTTGTDQRPGGAAAPQARLPARRGTPRRAERLAICVSRRIDKRRRITRPYILKSASYECQLLASGSE